MASLKVLWHWQTLGPYHFARMRALASVPGIELTVVESSSVDDHGWKRVESANDLDLITLASEPFSQSLLKQTQAALEKGLDMRRPDLIVVAGYASAANVNPMIRYKHSNPAALAVLWSEATALDRKRTLVKETLKALLVAAFDGAVVAGPSHASYLIQLGMRPSDIRVAGNCVDNDFFKNTADAIRRQRDGSNSLPASYFLFVGRMIPEKNLATLIDAYREYRIQAGASAWSLVLVGSGPEESALRTKVGESGIQGVCFAGLRQADELPQYYAHAKCFILPSISEPWGLVVNEAMASGLPVIASQRCGCAQDLVRPGVNGLLFDPFNRDSLVRVMQRISGPAVSLQSMSRQSLSIIEDYSPSLFAQRAAEHFQSLYQRRAQPFTRHTPQRFRRVVANGLYSISGLLT